MRDDYKVSTPDIDALVAIAQSHPAMAARANDGGGFGGAVVMVARAGTAAAAAREILRRIPPRPTAAGSGPGADRAAVDRAAGAVATMTLARTEAEEVLLYSGLDNFRTRVASQRHGRRLVRDVRRSIAGPS